MKRKMRRKFIIYEKRQDYYLQSQFKNDKIRFKHVFNDGPSDVIMAYV